MNILILSSGTRNKIVQYFKNELQGKGKVYTTDASHLAPSLYDSDGHFCPINGIHIIVNVLFTGV